MPRNIPDAHKDRTLTCGMCKWFDTEYRGRTCQQRRKVNDVTRACVEWERGSYAPNLKNVRKNKIFRNLRALLSSEELTIDKQGIEAEVIRQRTVLGNKERKINHRFHRPLKDFITLSELFEQTQAYRDRLVEISINMDIVMNQLYKWREKVRSKIAVEHTGVFEGFKTAAEKESVHTYLSSELEARIADGEHVSGIVDKAIKNIDQLYWSLKEIKGLGELIVAKRSDQAVVMNRPPR